MLIVISPAKLLDFITPPATTSFTMPEMLDESQKLINGLQKMNPKQISELMGISDNLGELNFQRFQSWHLPFTTFNGEVFRGLKATTFSAEQLKLAQTKLRILSGLYGILKPLDLMQPYRLEMGTKFKYQNSPNLYVFWKTLITEKINEAVTESGSGVLVNLASNEYFKSIDKKKLTAEIITPGFKDLKNGNYKTITVFAKKARGLMARNPAIRFLRETNNREYEKYFSAFCTK